MIWILIALGAYGIFLIGSGVLICLWALFEFVRQWLFPERLP